MSVVDCHAHLVAADLVADLAAGRLRFPHVEVTPHGDSHVVAFCGGKPTRPLAPGLTDLGRRDAWLGEQRVDRQVVGGWLDVFGYELPPDEGADWSRALTESIAGVTRSNDSLVPLGTVPLQDPEAAAKAVREQHDAGIPGVMIATRAGGRELDDPAFTSFWEAADDAGAVVFLHPGFGGASPRYADFGLVNGLARLEDTTVTLARLLYAGIPARHARMKLLVAHGGAALPYVLGRLVRNHLLDTAGTADPLESFARLYFDSVVFDGPTLEFLATKVGSDRILLGSDYPFPIGDLTPRAVVEATGVDADACAAMLGGTASALFALEGTM
ncbi:MAG: amidohydrolase family protein [Streptosporangiales bacterium]|nr:amidohydrolase family protein [Streptosporangiales bacterium]MBO0890110.1 amidohydrolase family protein [Acidothermales bacterium]